MIELLRRDLTAGVASVFTCLTSVLAAILVVFATVDLHFSIAHGNQSIAGKAESTRMDSSVIVSDQSFSSNETYEIIGSNVSFVNALFAEHLRPQEVPSDALRSYYVDYYLAQVNNGGFSQFIWNSKWPPKMIRLIREGLSAMKAVKHLEFFNELAATVERMGPDGLKAYLESDYFGKENAQRDALNKDNSRFFKLSETENLIALNAAWLRSIPNLKVKTVPEMEAEIERRAAALPDREERKRAAQANEPRYLKLVRALSGKAGHRFSHVTAGDPTHKYNGKTVLAWHFLTDRGHYYMIDIGGRAMMFDAKTKNKVAEIDEPER